MHVVPLRLRTVLRHLDLLCVLLVLLLPVDTRQPGHEVGRVTIDDVILHVHPVLVPAPAGGTGHGQVLGLDVLHDPVLLHHLLAQVAHQLPVLHPVPHLRDLREGTVAPVHVILVELLLTLLKHHVTGMVGDWIIKGTDQRMTLWRPLLHNHRSVQGIRHLHLLPHVVHPYVTLELSVPLVNVVSQKIGFSYSDIQLHETESSWLCSLLQEPPRLLVRLPPGSWHLLPLVVLLILLSNILPTLTVGCITFLDCITVTIVLVFI